MIDKTPTELLNRVLRHYKNRILSIKDDADISLGNDILKQDLEINASNVDLALEQLNNPNIGGVQDNDLLCSSIDCYIHDLQGAKDMVIKELGGAKLKFSEIEKEIDNAKWKKNENCKKSQS
jgi:phage tail tube protein FII